MMEGPQGPECSRGTELLRHLSLDHHMREINYIFCVCLKCAGKTAQHYTSPEINSILCVCLKYTGKTA